MRRLVIVIAITALAGAALATWGGVASAREDIEALGEALQNLRG